MAAAVEVVAAVEAVVTDAVVAVVATVAASVASDVAVEDGPDVGATAPDVLPPLRELPIVGVTLEPELAEVGVLIVGPAVVGTVAGPVFVVILADVEPVHQITFRATIIAT